MKKFECDCCGECCKKFQPNLSEFSELISDLNGPEYYYNVREIAGLPLFEWEVKELNNESKKLGISLEIKPDKIVIDLLSNKKIVYSWKLLQEPCPFLKNNKCLVYDKRPLICKGYPLSIKIDEVTDALSADKDVSCKCAFWPKDDPIINFYKYLYEVYDNCFIAAIKMKQIEKNYLDIFILLEKLGKIKLMKYEKQQPAFEKSSKYQDINVKELFCEHSITVDIENIADKYAKDIIECMC